MTDVTDVADRWRRESIAEYLDVDAGAPVTQAEALSVMNSEDHERVLNVVHRRIAELATRVPDDELAPMVGTALDELYRAGTGLALWSPDVAAYVRAAWATIVAALGARGYRVLFVVEHEYPERIGRPLELYPDLFTAAGATYVCPHAIANQLPAAYDAEVTVEGLAPFVAEGRELAVAEVAAAAADRHHVVYVEIAPEPGCLDAVLALGGDPGTLLVVRRGAPDGATPPEITVVARS